MGRDNSLTMTFGLLTGLSLVVADHEVASAATISFNNDFSMSQASNGDQPESDDVGLFDSSLGTLTGVRFLWRGFEGSGLSTFTGFLNVVASSDPEASDPAVGFAEVTGVITTTVTQGGLGIVLDRVGDGTNSCDGFPGCSTSAAFDESFTTTFDVAGASVAAFAAPGGGTFAVQHNLNANFSGDAEPFGGFDGLGIDWNGTFTVEYTYELTPPRDVPVPATIGLLGAGLAAIGAARRRQA